ncbi:MAG: tRNA-binding protein [Candidatus Wildermuthbacteria bacterium RIFCSPHIGHO2_01_FULL_48_27b]|uniref:tRNA-binding protein n=1 Tax=Candidatus Wildermuthbacteria bacterium RIFCSPHIGHO2_01_FULL_48_27b TaxID=1802447 RepID=A0A1G2QWA6_9BACT|nr:MAG: tRNA-binding protein [Candidatus Wildermuthbacteria bacterium RIFCSPHIGHO2_01_FULL_48_27b]
MEIAWEDFEKVDIRLGKVIEVDDFPKARNPAFRLKIDFGPPIGIKTSSVQAPGAHTKEELLGMLVCCVVNFPPKKVADFMSEVLTLGFKNTEGLGWILITPAKKSVEIGSKLT